MSLLYSFPTLNSSAIYDGDTTPVPNDGLNGLAWSTVLNTYVYWNGTMWRGLLLHPLMAARTSQAAASGSTTTQTLVSATPGSNSLAAGNQYILEAYGQTDNVAAGGTLNVNIKFNTSVLLTFALATATTAQSAMPWYIRAIITIRTTGASGTVIAAGYAIFTASGTPNIVLASSSATTAAVTGGPIFAIAAAWSAAVTGNNFRCDGASLIQRVGTGLVSATTQVAPTRQSYSAIVLADSPIAYWRCNEASGTAAVDSTTGNARPMTVGTGVSLGGAALGAGDTGGGSFTYISSASPTTSKISRTAALSSGDALYPTLSSYSVEFTFVAPATLPPTNTLPALIALGSDTTQSPFIFIINTTSQLQVYLTTTAATRNTGAQAALALTAGAVYHVVSVFTAGSSWKTYLNGVLAYTSGSITSSDTGINWANAYSAGAAIGSDWSAGDKIPGCAISNLSVFNTALSSTQVANHYSGFTGS